MKTPDKDRALDGSSKLAAVKLEFDSKSLPIPSVPVRVAVSATSSGSFETPEPKSQNKPEVNFLNADFFSKDHLLALLASKGEVVIAEKK